MENDLSMDVPKYGGSKELVASNGLKKKLSLSHCEQTILHGNHPTIIQYLNVLIQTMALKELFFVMHSLLSTWSVNVVRYFGWKGLFKSEKNTTP